MAKNAKNRQEAIIAFVQEHGEASSKELGEAFPDAARITLVRDLNALVVAGVVERVGAGRGVRYRAKAGANALQPVDMDAYFAVGPDERKGVHERFDFAVFDMFPTLFLDDELRELEGLTRDYRKRFAKLTSVERQREFERLTIELSWKSSAIEGNTYSLIDTEVLIKEHKEAPGHRKEEAVMIWNHKRALEYASDKRSDFRTLTLAKVRSIHDMIVEGLNIERGFRRRPAGITGTRYRPLDNEHEIRDAMERMVALVNDANDPFAKALLAITLLSYIQPFGDGNKRTARILGNAILLAHDACPLSYRSVNEADYKKAMIIFYERQKIRPFKELFMAQYRFAVEQYFLA